MNGRDWVPMILAIGVSLAVIILCLALLLKPLTLTERGGEALASTLGVMSGVVAVYIGRRVP